VYTEDQVFEMLSSLDVKKANGWDGISARMLKSTAGSIAHMETHCCSLQDKYPKPGKCPQ